MPMVVWFSEQKADSQEFVNIRETLLSALPLFGSEIVARKEPKGASNTWELIRNRPTIAMKQRSWRMAQKNQPMIFLYGISRIKEI